MRLALSYVEALGGGSSVRSIRSGQLRDMFQIGTYTKVSDERRISRSVVWEAHSKDICA